ncbi:hypothetical protein TeGR_g6196, partial [Tetraparma gracilis]
PCPIHLSFDPRAPLKAYLLAGRRWQILLKTVPPGKLELDDEACSLSLSTSDGRHLSLGLGPSPTPAARAAWAAFADRLFAAVRAVRAKQERRLARAEPEPADSFRQAAKHAYGARQPAASRARAAAAQAAVFSPARKREPEPPKPFPSPSRFPAKKAAVVRSAPKQILASSPFRRAEGLSDDEVESSSDYAEEVVVKRRLPARRPAKVAFSIPEGGGGG